MDALLIDASLLQQMLIGALLGLSVYLPLRCGQLSLATPGFYAIGGTLAALLSTRVEVLGGSEPVYPLSSVLLEMLLAAALAGVHHGLKNKIDPGPMIEGNGYEQPCDPMPTNWFAALETFKRSSFASDYFGSEFVRIFSAIKEIEADRFYAEPQPLDFEFYLRTI
jgi:hypothetical protein